MILGANFLWLRLFWGETVTSVLELVVVVVDSMVEVEVDDMVVVVVDSKVKVVVESMVVVVRDGDSTNTTGDCCVVNCGTFMAVVVVNLAVAVVTFVNILWLMVVKFSAVVTLVIVVVDCFEVIEILEGSTDDIIMVSVVVAGVLPS